MEGGGREDRERVEGRRERGGDSLGRASWGGGWGTEKVNLQKVGQAQLAAVSVC